MREEIKVYNCLAGKCVKSDDMEYMGFCFCGSKFGCDFQGEKEGIVKWQRINAEQIKMNHALT